LLVPAWTPENLTLCWEYHLNLGVRASVAPSCSLCLRACSPSTGHQTPSTTPPYGCLLHRASPSRQQPHTILHKFGSPPSPAMGVHNALFLDSMLYIECTRGKFSAQKCKAYLRQQNIPGIPMICC